MTLAQNNIYILGSGHFGQRAAMLLKKRNTDGVITVVDRQPQALATAETLGCQTISMDAIAFLTTPSHHISPDDWIVPVVPIHVAHAWLMAGNKSDFQLKETSVPDSIAAQIPNPMWGDNGQVYTSIATFHCPQDCSEPTNLCTLTGKPRPLTLWEKLSSLNLPGFHPICIRSHQMAPGVGGFQFKALLQARQVIKTNHGKFLLSTACKCHGVINGLAHEI